MHFPNVCKIQDKAINPFLANVPNWVKWEHWLEMG